MKTKGLPAIAVVAILLAAVLAPAMGLSLMNNSNSSVNSSESLNDSITNPVPDHDPETPTPIPTPSSSQPIEESDNNATDTDTEANQTETVNESVDVVYDSTSTPKPVIIMFKDKSDADLIKQHGGQIKSAYRLKPALAASLPQKAIDNLRSNPKIEFIVDDLQIFTMGETLDWGVDRIDAAVVHESNNNGTGINVAIMDTGIDYAHPDLTANYEGGYDFGGGYTGAPNDADPMDFNGHGTHCAGIAAAVRGNEIGVIGVAPEADLYAVKVFTDDGYGSYSDVVEALEWCIDTRTDDNPDNDIQVISMSFGSAYSAGDPGIESWINAAYDAGILLVGAAGNDGNPGGSGDSVIYPARYENVIAVAATDSSDNRASWSSTGPAVELAAPGVSIYSTYLDNGYAAMSGTSMACPHVTGTAALVWNAYPDYNNTEVRQRMQATAEDLGAAGKDTWYGYGLVDASAAASPTGSPDESPVVATPRTYDNTTLEEKTVFERNDSMFINVSISDINGASDLNTVLITILNTTNATIPILNNDTMTQDTPITDGYVYNYSWLVPGDADSGTWTLKVYANDTGGNVGSASVQFVVNFTNATVPENKNITVDLIAMKKHFALNENPEFEFIVNYNTTAGEFKTNETDAGLSGFDAPKPRKALKMLVTSDETIKTAVYYKDELVDIALEIEKIGEGDFSIKIASRRAFRAGLYKLKVELVKNNVTYVEEEEFEWGLVSLNTRKSIYKPGETAEFIIVVLDKDGHPVCHTDVSLVVTNPNNEKAVYSTADGTILPGKECGIYNADYLTHVEGNHTIDISTLIGGAAVEFSTYFLVQQDYEFDIIRTAKSKIDPIKQDWFDVTIDIESFVGANAIIIKEFVPAEFDLNTDADVMLEGDTKILLWNMNLAGNKTSVSYSYSVPHIWPYLYALGPAEIGYGSETFTEARAWYVAVDPTNKLYESSTLDFTSETAVIDLLSSRDGTANNVDFVLASSNLYTFVNATSNAVGSDIVIAGGSTINFSAYFSCGSRVNYAYATWKFYKVSDSTETLICQKGDDSTSGVQLPDEGSATLTGSCTVSSAVTLNSTDKLRLVLNVWAETIGGGSAATKHAKHYWDSTYESWVQYEYIALPKTNETSVNATAVGVNDIICVNHTVTKGTYDIDKTWVEITYPSGTSANITTSNTTGVCGAGGNVYGVEINVGSTTGNLTVNTSWVNDTQGNIDYDDPYQNILVSVQDLKAPQWSDAQTNKTTIYEGDYVKFTANWTDDVDLAGYKFSTNQSGAWVNSSFTPFSGTSNTSENVTQITASAGTTVQWRFYANDTSDNWNETDNQSFVVTTPPPPPSTPYMIYGRVFYKNGTACNNPAVNITNMNTSKQWSAKTNASYNYYQLMLSNGTDLNASEILRFNVRDASGVQFKIFNHTINETEVNNGGLFDFNITLVAPETPFMIYGWVNYGNGTACNGSTVNITNTNTSITWQAETNASYNFYQLILDTTNISADNVLSFNATDGTQFNVTSHTVTQKNITDGGIFDFNITIGIEEPVKIRNYNNTADLDSWAFSGGMGENVTVSWQNSSNGTPTCVIWNSGPDGITVCIYAANFTDGDGVQFNPNATEKIVVRDDGNTTPIDWSVVTDYVSNKNESSSSWYNFPLGAGEVRDVYLQLCIPMNVKSGTYNSTFYAKKKE